MGADTPSGAREGGVPGVVAGAVLAGGRSRRMGADKASIEVDGATMFERAASALRGAGCHPVIAVGGPRRAGVGHVADLHPGEGPLGGILTALIHGADVGATAVAVLACDMPSVSAHTIRQMVDAAEGGVRLVAARGERIEPLCSVWPVSLVDLVRESFDAGERSPARLLDRLEPFAVAVDAAGLVNVNTPDDLASVDHRRLNEPSAGDSLR